MDSKYTKRRIKKALVLLLELLAIGLVLYLVILPFYPKIKYKLTYDNKKMQEEAKNEDIVKEKVQEIKSHLPKSEYAVSPNRLIITKIGLNSPIVNTDNEDYGLSKGAWLVPETSTPEHGGNTVITGHRFKYLPPNNLTFYLFHELENEDIISVIWQEQDFYYRIKEIKKVPKTETSILSPTSNSTLTLYTCDPIWSDENRLVVVGELIK